MDKYIIAIHGFGVIGNPSTMGEKMLGNYLRDLSAKPKYQNPDYTKNISIAQFMKLTIPPFKMWQDPKEKFKLNCHLESYGFPLESSITGLKKDYIDYVEEFMCKQSLEKRIITIEEHASFSDKKPCLIIAINPIIAASTIDDYLENVKQDMIMAMPTRGSTVLS